MPGLSVLLLDTETRTNNYYITLAIEAALNNLSDVGRVALATHAEAIPLMQEEHFDVFLAFGGAVRHHPILERCCALADVSVLWTTEDPYERRGNVTFSKCFDIVFTNDSSSVSAYDGRAHHLPLAASRLFQDLPVRTHDSDYRYDLMFVGTAWPNRVTTINKILRALPEDAKVKIALPWNEYLPKPELERSNLVTDWRCGNADFARLANSSRITLMLERAFSASDITNAQGASPPPRLYEVALAGGCQLIVSDKRELLDYYADASEIALCPDEEAVVDVLLGLLADPERRISMAQKARERTLGEHLYEHRLAELIRIVKNLQRRETPIVAPTKKKVLFVTHNRTGQRRGGGIEVYQERLAAELDGFEPSFMYPVIGEGAGSLRVDNGEFPQILPLPEGSNRLISATAEAFFEKILMSRDVSLVHFHHLMFFPLSLPMVSRSVGVPSVFHIHDFHLICSRFNLLNAKGVFCDVVNTGSGQCDGCLLMSEGRPIGAKAKRDNFVARMLKSVDGFVASTPYSGDYLKGFYPEITNKRIDLIEMIDPILQDNLLPSYSSLRLRNLSGPIRIAILGNVVHHKGADTLEELIRRSSGQNFIFEIYGFIEIYLIDRFRALVGPNVRLRGGYTPDEVPALLLEVDVSLHLSIWPETYMISLTEAWRYGVIPIVTNLGAPGERVVHEQTGLLIPPNDASAVLNALWRLRYEPDLVCSMGEAIDALRFPNIGEHARAIERLYGDLIKDRPVPLISGKQPGFDLNAFDIGLRVNAPEWTDPEHQWDAPPSLNHPLASRITSAPPSNIAALELKELPQAEAATRCKIIDVAADGRTVSADMASHVVCDTLNLAVRVIGPHGAPGSVVFRLTGGAGEVVFASTTLEDSHNGDFRALIDAAHLRAGGHTVDVLLVFDDHVLVAPDVLAFHAAGMRPLSVVQPWRSGNRAEFLVEAVAAQGRLTGHTLHRVGGHWVASQGDSILRLSARVENAGYPARAVFVLRSVLEQGATYWAEGVVSESGDGGADWILSVDTRVHGLAGGDYKVLIAPIEMRAEPFVDCSFLLTITSGKAIFAKIDKVDPPSARAKVHIDRVRETRTPAGLTLLVEGWLFRGSRGQPKDVVLTRQVGDHQEGMVFTVRRRPDVAATLGDSDALYAGFKIEALASLVLDDTARLIQRCSLEDVEALGWAKQVRSHLRGEPLGRARRLRLKTKAALSSLSGRDTAISETLTHNAGLIRQSGVFDVDWYRSQQTDIGSDPIVDYLKIGSTRGASPHPLFDSQWYGKRYPDIGEGNPLIHYLKHGGYEGRDPSPLFASAWLVARHIEMQGVNRTPLEVYCRDDPQFKAPTTPIFDAAWYTQTYETEGVSLETAFRHFVERGAGQGLDPGPFFCRAPEQTAHPDAPWRHWLASNALNVDWYKNQYSEHVPLAGSAWEEYTDRGAAAGRLPNTPSPSLSNARIAVVAHVFYEEMWAQLLEAMTRFPIGFDLYVTVPAAKAAIIEPLVRLAFPSAIVIATDTGGRDIGPFFDALELIFKTEYTAICKIHTKKGVTHPAVWRRLLLDGVLGSSALICDIVQSFLEKPKLGLVGHSGLYFSGPMHLGVNENNVKSMCEYMFKDKPVPNEWGFIAGTMFWIRPSLLKPLAEYVGDMITFNDDNSSNDGQAAHALERVIGLMVAANGAEVGLVESFQGGPTPQILRIVSAGATNKERPERYLDRQAAEYR